MWVPFGGLPRGLGLAMGRCAWVPTRGTPTSNPRTGRGPRYPGGSPPGVGASLVGALRGPPAWIGVGHGRCAWVPTRGTPTSNPRTGRGPRILRRFLAWCRGIPCGCPSGASRVDWGWPWGVAPGCPQGAPLHQTLEPVEARGYLGGSSPGVGASLVGALRGPPAWIGVGHGALRLGTHKGHPYIKPSNRSRPEDIKGGSPPGVGASLVGALRGLPRGLGLAMGVALGYPQGAPLHQTLEPVEARGIQEVPRLV